MKASINELALLKEDAKEVQQFLAHQSFGKEGTELRDDVLKASMRIKTFFDRLALSEVDIKVKN